MFSALKKRSTTFRLALGFMAVFAASFFILGFFVYLQATSYLEQDLQASIVLIGGSVLDVYRNDGLDAMVAEIESRAARDPDGDEVYLLVDRQCNPVSGSLDKRPPVEQIGPRCNELFEGAEWFDYELAQGSPRRTGNLVLGRVLELDEDHGFLYGRVMAELDILEETILTALLWGLVLMLGLGVGGSVVMSKTVAARLEKLNRTSLEIRRGNLSSRMPVDHAHDEFDRLALNLNEMMDQIEALMEGIKEVSNSIAHDLRTPLTRLNHDLEELRALLPPDAHLNEHVEHAIGEADKMLGTFNALLSIAQIEAGGRRRDFAEMDLAHVVTDVVEFYWPLAADKGITLHTQIEGATGFVGDQDLISQAISNLVDNAIKYTPPGGAVTVALEDSSGGHRLIVSDSGPGIPKSEHENVFNRFYRLEAHRESEGNGLGLSLVAAVAKLHNAAVELSSNHPGLRVSLDFPA